MKKVAAQALVLSLALPAFAGPNATITNGNLQAQTVQNTDAVDFSVLPGTPYPDSWTILRPNGEAWDSYGGKPSPDGGKYWGVQYLEGWNDFNAPYTPRQNALGISQNITGLTVGKTYQISFWSMADHTQSTVASAYWAVNFEGVTQNSTPLKSDGSYTWVQNTMSFVATSSSSVLKFTSNFSNATPASTPMILNLDGITISAVPEPAEAGMLLAGLVAVGMLTYRRRSRG